MIDRPIIKEYATHILICACLGIIFAIPAYLVTIISLAPVDIIDTLNKTNNTYILLSVFFTMSFLVFTGDRGMIQ